MYGRRAFEAEEVAKAKGLRGAHSCIQGLAGGQVAGVWRGHGAGAEVREVPDSRSRHVRPSATAGTSAFAE